MEIRSVLERSATQWLQDNVPSMSAAVAFYALLSLAPLLVIALWMLAVLADPATVRHDLIAQLRLFTGPQAISGIDIVLEAAQKPLDLSLRGVLGIAATLFGAQGVFVETRSALNRIWHFQKYEAKGTLTRILLDRAISLATNAYQVFKGQETVADAGKNVSGDLVSAGVGGAAGAVASAIATPMLAAALGPASLLVTLGGIGAGIGGYMIADHFLRKTSFFQSLTTKVHDTIAAITSK